MSRRVGRSSDTGTYHSQESDAGTVRSNTESRASTRSSDYRFSGLHPRSSGANSELGSVVSEHGDRPRSSNPSAGRYGGSTSTVRTLSEAGSARTQHAASSSGTRSSIARAQRGFQPGLPSVAETLSQAGSGRDIDVGALLDRLSVMSEAEREQDPAFSELRSFVSRQADQLARSRASQPASTHAPSTRAPSTRASSTRAPSTRASARHPFAVSEDDVLSSDEAESMSHSDLLELRARRRRNRRPQLAAQIDRSRES